MACDCSLREKICVGDVEGTTVIVLLGLPIDEGFPDGAESGNNMVIEGTSVANGIDEELLIPVDGLEVMGFDVVIGATVTAIGAVGKQFMHFNKTAQSQFEFIGARPIVLIMFDSIDATEPFWKSPPMRGSYHSIEYDFPLTCNPRRSMSRVSPNGRYNAMEGSPPVGSSRHQLLFVTR